MLTHPRSIPPKRSGIRGKVGLTAESRDPETLPVAHHCHRRKFPSPEIVLSIPEENNGEDQAVKNMTVDDDVAVAGHDTIDYQLYSALHLSCAASSSAHKPTRRIVILSSSGHHTTVREKHKTI